MSQTGATDKHLADLSAAGLIRLPAGVDLVLRADRRCPPEWHAPVRSTSRYTDSLPV